VNGGVALAVEKSSKKRNRPCRTERARKKARRLEEELSQTNHLVHRLVEVNQASTYAASLQADLNKDLVSLAFRRQQLPSNRVPTPSLSPSPQPSPNPPTPSKGTEEIPTPVDRSPSPPSKTVIRYKKFWSDEGTLSSDISLAGLPTEEITIVGAAKRLSLESRITSPKPPKPLLERLASPDPIDYTSDNPFNFIPTDFGIPPPDGPPYVPKALPPLYEDQHNLYHDPRRRNRRR
jgi:hypothetical protein